jgi:hypothetical protein
MHMVSWTHITNGSFQSKRLLSSVSEQSIMQPIAISDREVSSEVFDNINQNSLSYPRKRMDQDRGRS